MGRTPCCSKVGLHRGPWTAREDALLIKYIETHGEGQWRSLPKKAGLLRCGKSCRLRWMNYLRPDIKRGNITPEEDDLIIRLHGLLGNRWSLIAGRLPGRTDNEIKNYWNTHLSKRLRSEGTDPNTHKKLPGVEVAEKTTSNSNKRSRRGKGKTQKTKEIHKKGSILDTKDDITSDEKKKTKVHLPKPVKVASNIIPLTRNNSSASFETYVSTSASSSQSQNQTVNPIQNHELTYESSENVILDMPWLSINDGLDHLMMMGSCCDVVDLDIDIIQSHDHHIDHDLDTKDMQFEKLYEEYLQLIKADHHKDDGDDDDDDAQLDSFTRSFLV